MSLWSRLRDRVRGARAAEPVVVVAKREEPVRVDREPRHEVDELARLSRVGAANGPTIGEAIAVLRRMRGTVREAEALARALDPEGGEALVPVRIACAEILAARGEEARALALLEGVIDPGGLVLAADLHAATGQIARAVGTIERVLARDIGMPGARERHARWTAALGAASSLPRRLDEVTIVAPTAGKTPFRLLREVARGGAGVVYEGEDAALGRRVAFKVYHGRGNDRAALLREARLAASLAGPGVVRVLDADPDEGWLALEWVGRGSVRDALRTGDVEALLPIGRWALPLASALGRVHAAGIVHGDVKPANVLLRAPDEPVLGDFGLARPRGAPSEGGSAGYVSPERLAGAAGDPRDDVYGLGRTIEDVLHHAGVAIDTGRLGAAHAASLHPWIAVATRCIGDARPADGAALARELGLL